MIRALYISLSIILLGAIFICLDSWLDTQSLQRELIRVNIIQQLENSNDPILKQKLSHIKSEIQDELDLETNIENQLRKDNHKGIDFSIFLLGCPFGMLLYFFIYKRVNDNV